MFISRPFIISSILFFTLTQSSPTLAEISKGTWALAAPAPTQRTEVAVAAIEGKIYVVGGFNKPNLQNALKFAISNDVEVYDTASDSWSTTTPLPEGRYHAGIASLNGLLYVVGGFTQSFMSIWHAVPTVYQYNPATKAWRELAPMPTARGALGVAIYQNRLYAIGGYDGKYNSGAVEIFDPHTNTWSSGASMPTPRDHLAVTTAGSRIYAIGGESADGTFNTNEAYHPGTDQWRTMTPMPTARHGLGSAVVDGCLYVISGGPTPGGSFSQVNEVFTPPAVE